MENNYYQYSNQQQPGAPQNGAPYKPDSNLVWAILSTLLCCLPLGIVSIVYSSKVDNLYYAGRYEEAQAASNSARNWALAAAISAIVGVVLYIVIVVVMIGGMAGLSSMY